MAEGRGFVIVVNIRPLHQLKVSVYFPFSLPGNAGCSSQDTSHVKLSNFSGSGNPNLSGNLPQSVADQQPVDLQQFEYIDEQ